MSFKVAVAGFGVAGHAHAGAWSQLADVEIAGVYTPVPELETPLVREALSDQIPVFDDYDQMLSEVGPQIVSICTTHDHHARQAIAAADMGAHLVLEKPFCMTLDELRDIKRAVDGHDVSVCAGFQEFHYGQFLATLSLLDQGFLGDVHLAETSFMFGLRPDNPQYRWARTVAQAGSTLRLAGIHALHLLLLCMKDEVIDEVVAYTTSSSSESFRGLEYPGTLVGLIRFASGRIGKISSSMDSLQPYTFTCTLIGSEGSIIDRKLVSRKIDGLDLYNWTDLGTRSIADGAFVTSDMYVPMFKSYISALKGGPPLRFTNMAAAYRTHRVLFALEQSAQEGHVVRLEHDDQ